MGQILTKKLFTNQLNQISENGFLQEHVNKEEKIYLPYWSIYNKINFFNTSNESNNNVIMIVFQLKNMKNFADEGREKSIMQPINHKLL